MLYKSCPSLFLRTHKPWEDPLGGLTKTFVEELNHLVETRSVLSVRRVKRLRIILFFDTFEQLAIDVAPWLLDYFLEANINNNVVLVVAGRDPIEQSTPDDLKRWLPYHNNNVIYSISLNGFTKEETRLYLAERGITDPGSVSTTWQLSRGLPLYLGLLTSNLYGNVDPTANVVTNFLRWIPEQEQIKRQLALDAALFSRSFNQDDLEAFTYLSENKRPELYRWLIGQPFVRPQDGRYSYHDLARELFSRHLVAGQKPFHQTSNFVSPFIDKTSGCPARFCSLLIKCMSEGGDKRWFVADVRRTDGIFLPLAHSVKVWVIFEQPDKLCAPVEILPSSFSASMNLVAQKIRMLWQNSRLFRLGVSSWGCSQGRTDCRVAQK
jgi:hypothetical protein